MDVVDVATTSAATADVIIAAVAAVPSENVPTAKPKASKKRALSASKNPKKAKMSDLTADDALLAADGFINANTLNGVINFDNVWFNMSHGSERHELLKGKSLDGWGGAQLRKAFEENALEGK